MLKEEVCRNFAIRSDWVGVLPNGISDDFLQRRHKECDAKSLREKLGLSNKFVIIYHGAFRHNGGLLESIGAIGLIKNDHPDIVLFLLGTGPPQLLPVLRREIETNSVQENVVLHEPVDFHSVPDYILMSDVGLVPLPNIAFWRYSQPLKLLEYMAMGKTIIAADSPAHRYVTGENSNIVYVRNLNPNELAKAMIYAYKNRDKLEDWGKVGQQVVTEKYVWKKVNRDLTDYLMGIQLGEGYKQGILGREKKIPETTRDNHYSLMTALHAAKGEKWLRQASRYERQKKQMQRRRKLENLAIISQFCHLVTLTVKRPRTQLECGALVTSIDVDVGSSLLGERNKGKNDSNVHGYLSERYVGKVEEEIVPTLIRFFDNLAIPVTFAIRGQLVEVENSILEQLLNSPIEHEIGAHGYYHRTFTSLSRAQAQNELEMISTGFQKFGVKPTSFVFPWNRVSHLNMLERFGYVSYRDEGGLLKEGMFVRRKGQLYDVHPGFHLGLTYDPIFLNKIIDIAATRRLPFHVWFHPRDLFETRGSTQKTIERVLSTIYKYAKEKEKEGTLKFETMQSIVNKIKHQP
jgi:peptidoglycan/xylan/chitin deacetylase (PgdA/CDA1 family)